MRLSKTDADKLRDELYSLVSYIIALAEADEETYGLPNTVKARAIKELTDNTFCSILRKIQKQRDRAVAISPN